MGSSLIELFPPRFERLFRRFVLLFVQFLSQFSRIVDSVPPTIMLISFAGLIASLAAIYGLNVYGPRWRMERGAEAMFLLACIAIPMFVFSLLSSYLTGTDKSKHTVVGLTHLHLGYRYLGFFLTTFIVALVYWTVDEYHSSFVDGIFGIDDRPLEFKDGKVILREAHTHPKYYNFFRILGLALHICGGWKGVITGCIVYIGLTNYHAMIQGGDGLYYTGRGMILLLQQLVLPSSATIDKDDISSLWSHLTQHFLEIFVRAFYAPLLFCHLCDNLPMLHYKSNETFSTYMHGFRYINNIVFTIDLSVALLGYMLPFSRIHGTHFRSTDNSTLGIVSALICYSPIFDMVTSRYFDYARNLSWHEWFDRLNGQQDASGWMIFQLWGACITILQGIFAWCTLCYGLAYSNLSYRTVVRTGPYYFCKHPAYIVKLWSFAMLHVPWVDLKGDNGAGRAIRNVLCLLGVAGIYVIRAITEERHLLSVSTEYQNYVTELETRWQGWWAPFRGNLQ